MVQFWGVTIIGGVAGIFRVGRQVFYMPSYVGQSSLVLFNFEKPPLDNSSV